MKQYRLYCRDVFSAAPVAVADRFGTRLCGLMFRRALPPGAGLLLVRCSSIHCCFMRFAIDAVYLDRDLRVVGVETVRPWRLGGHFAHARHVLELNEHAASALVPGDVLCQEELGEKQ